MTYQSYIKETLIKIGMAIFISEKVDFRAQGLNAVIKELSHQEYTILNVYAANNRTSK